MKLIVGLGNIGKEYNNTRHNAGFMAVDKIAESLNLLITNKKMDGLYADTIYKGEKVILLKPQLFINLSGDVIKKYVDFYKLDLKDVLVIHDDLDLSVGKIKLKYKGSSGGHNGLKNIEANFHTNVYNRIKIGISNNKNIDTKDYVLGKIPKEDMDEITNVIDKMPNIFIDYMNMSFDNLMNKYNTK